MKTPLNNLDSKYLASNVIAGKKTGFLKYDQ